MPRLVQELDENDVFLQAMSVSRSVLDWLFMRAVRSGSGHPHSFISGMGVQESDTRGDPMILF